MGLARFFSLAFLGFTWGIVSSLPVTAGPPVEPYSSRPNVLQVKPQGHSNLGSDWEKLKRGHIEAVAQLLELYPDREIYFLARDSELLYDLAKHVTRDEPAICSRIHLLNVSRANMNAAHIKDYLAQEGISEASLQAGKKIVFVDTGFSGTIPRVIGDLFPQPLRPQLQTHLLSSSNPDHPSSRVFLSALNPAVNLSGPTSLHGTVVSYEHMPRYTDRSDRFEKMNDRWEPVSEIGTATDGSVSKEKAIAYQQDLIAYANQASQRALLQKRREQWRHLKETQKQPQLEVLTSLLKTGSANDPVPESMVRDWLEVTQKNLFISGTTPITPTQLGLEIEAQGVGASNKNLLIKKYPQWAQALEDPVTGINGLIKNKKWGELGAISDVIQDQEFTRILAQALAKAPPSPERRHFVASMVEKAKSDALPALAVNFFSHPQSVDLGDLFSQMVKNGDSKTRSNVCAYVFSQPHSTLWKSELDAIVDQAIASADTSVLNSLAQSVFHYPHSVQWGDVLARVIEANNPNVLTFLALNVFSIPHATQWSPQLFSRFIEKSRHHEQQVLARVVFSKPHATVWKQQLSDLIDRSDSFTLRMLAQQTFSQPHTAPWEDIVIKLINTHDPMAQFDLTRYSFSEPHSAQWGQALDLLIEKGNEQVLKGLAEYVFSRPHSQNLTSQLRRLIEKANSETLATLLRHSLHYPHWNTPNGRRFREAASVKDPTQRKTFLNQTTSCLKTALTSL